MTLHCYRIPHLQFVWGLPTPHAPPRHFHCAIFLTMASFAEGIWHGVSGHSSPPPHFLFNNVKQEFCLCPKQTELQIMCWIFFHVCVTFQASSARVWLLSVFFCLSSAFLALVSFVCVRCCLQVWERMRVHMSNVRWAASSCVVYRECVFVCVCERER